MHGARRAGFHLAAEAGRMGKSRSAARISRVCMRRFLTHVVFSETFYPV